MTQLTLGSAEVPKVLVWVGDSKSFSSQSTGFPETYPDADNFRRWGDRHAVDLAASGVRRYTGWGTREKLWGSAPYDVTFQHLAVAGSQAHNWPDSPVAQDIPAEAWGSHVDYLVVQFGGNEYNAGTDPEVFRAALVARLNEWTNVARKFVFMATTNRLGPNSGNPPLWGPNPGAQPYWEAGRQAAVDATPGYLQDEVRFRALFGRPHLLADTGSGPLSGWTYDRTHLTAEGARRYFLDFRSTLRGG